MKIAVFGAEGFLGRALVKELQTSGHDVQRGVDTETGDRIDLLDAVALKAYFQKVTPETIVNCAGVVDASREFENNVRFSENILIAVAAAGLSVRNIIIMGSSAEYGEPAGLPVAEDAQLKGVSPYALSKIKEEQTALAFAEESKVSVIVARVFNPLGIGMKEKFLIPGLLRQIRGFRLGEQDHIEISRLDSRRDYIDVRDVARALKALTEGSPRHKTYNIGSGTATSNAEVLELLLKNLKLSSRPRIIETSETPEPQVASQADISRIRQEFGWEPKVILEQTIKDVIDASE